MIEHLSVRNVATLASVEVDLPGGFVVLTGETGAGKSLLVESLRFALGGRARHELIREGEERAEVSAAFRLPAGHEIIALLDEADLLDPDEPERLLLRRVVRRSGRGTLQVNGASMPLRALEPLRRLLVDLTSQHDHVRLLDPSTHRELLDSTPAVAPTAEGYREAFEDWRVAVARREDLARSARQREERSAELTDLLSRASYLAPEHGEEERLEGRWTRMVHAEDLQAAASKLYSLLEEAEGCASEVLAAGSPAARDLARLDPEQGEPLAERYYGLQEQAGELAREVLRYGENVEADPRERAALETRLEELKRLRRHLGCDAETLIESIEQARREQASLLDEDEDLSHADQAVAAARQRLDGAAETMREARAASIPGLISAVEGHLESLQMPHARLRVDLQPHPAPAPDGPDAVRLLIRTNPGEAFAPLDRIASGGELSRTLLALKAANADADPVLCTVFDEVDTDISGHTALAVGRLLRGLSEHRQVLCISHLPQVAASAEQHLHVLKDVQEGRTYTRVDSLEGDARVEVISQMLGGEATEAALAHARELLS
jgi:DNA repair protein RecN (Recombination protein N)